MKIIKKLSLLLLLMVSAHPKPFIKDQSQEPLYVKADKLTFDRDLKQLNASGHIQIKQTLEDGNERTLLCDELIYDQKNHWITAKGHVTLIDPSNVVTYGDFVRLSDDFRDAFVSNVKMLLSHEEERLAGEKARLIDKEKTILENAVYSPCELCQTTKNPLWQMRAKEIQHSKTDKTITCQNVTLEVFGVPVMYFPYWWMPDPTVKRKSGFLFPKYMNSSNVGNVFMVPYYYVLNDQSDLTITPVFLQDGFAGLGEYRHAFKTGDLNVQGSIARANYETYTYNPTDYYGYKYPSTHRWSFIGEGKYFLPNNSLAKVSIKRASDLTYLRRYPFFHRQHPNSASQKDLPSTIEYNTCQDNFYVGMKGEIFQTDIPEQTPDALPWINFLYQKDWLNGLVTLEGDATQLNRPYHPGTVFTNFSDTQYILTAPKNSLHFFLNGEWLKSIRNTLGHLFEISLSSRVDFYHFKDLLNPYSNFTLSTAQSGATPPLQNTSMFRFLPKLALQWTYPLIRFFKDGFWKIEPTIKAIFSKCNPFPQTVYNNDIVMPHLSKINLFANHRFQGLDIFDSGNRVVVGFTQRFKKNITLDWFIGQSYRLDRHQVFPITLPTLGGVENTKRSDLLNKITLYLNNNLTWQSQIATATDGSGRYFADHRLSVNGNFGNFYIGLIDQSQWLNNPGITQASLGFQTAPYNDWTFGGTQRFNLHRKQLNLSTHNLLNMGSKNLAYALDAKYQGQCFNFSVGFYKTNFFDRDIKPDHGLIFSLGLKNLGDFKKGISS